MSGIGLIVPSINCVTEDEWRWAWPNGLPYYVARARYVHGDDAMERLCEDALRAAEDLAPVKPDLGLFACTAASYVDNDALSESLTKRMGCRVITASTAVVDAFRAVGAVTVALVTPYAARSLANAVGFLGGNGFSVTHACGLDIDDGVLESEVPTEEVAAYARREVQPGTADAVFLASTNLRSWPAARELEREFGCPVITSNQATVWAAGAKLAPDRFGQLFSA